MRAAALCLALGLLGAVPAPAPGQEDAAALYREAMIYDEGIEATQNFARAAALMARAAEAGHAPAQNRLGQYYHAGLGVAQDQAAAIRWLRRAAGQGDPQHLFDLGAALENGADGSSDPAAAATAYAAAAEAGHVEAMVSLGALYQEGSGVPRDAARARALYENAAQAGAARAMNNLGLLYVRGEGVAQDYARAFTLFERAAEAGLSQAIRNLGVMYENGYGTEVDERRAHDLYRRAGQSVADAPTEYPYDPMLVRPPRTGEVAARLERLAEGGDPVARYMIAYHMVAEDPPGPQDRLAARWMRAAADAGMASAMTALGLMYFEGRGVPQDYVSGLKWLTLASAAGDVRAAGLSSRLALSMTAEQVNIAQSLAETQWTARQGATTSGR